MMDYRDDLRLLVRSIPEELQNESTLAASDHLLKLIRQELHRHLRLGRKPTQRAKLTRHLHTHPDHAHFYPAGHDFVLRSNVDIREEHMRQHGWREGAA